MKYLFPFLAALFFTANTFAQDVLNISDMPGDNDNLRYSNLSSFGSIDFRSTGANHVWDFSQLTPTSQGYYEYENIFEINFLFLPLFGFNTFGRQTAEEINLGTVQLENIYTYYEKNNSTFKSIGRSLNISGIPAPAKHSDSEIIYKLPLKYGDTNSDTYALNFPDVGLGILYSVSGTREYEVDGWGTVITPHGSFDCLRVKSTISETNLVEVQGVPLSITIVTEEYTWLSKGEKTPVFEVGTQKYPLLGFRPTYMRYKDIYQPCLNTRPEIDFTARDTVIYVRDTISFQNHTLCGTGNRTWSVSPSNGVFFVNGTNKNSENPTLEFATKGLYTVSLTEENTLGRDNLRKTDYIEVLLPNSVSEISPSDIEIFPNPFSDFIQIEATENIEQIDVFDLTGKKIYSKTQAFGKKAKLAIPNVDEGLYFVLINQKFRQKIMRLP